MTATTTAPATTTWTIDPVHSEVEFSVKHMLVATAKGRFGQVEGAIQFDPDDFAASSATIEIDAASITTHQPDRDTHLRSDDFFNAEQFPKIIFRSTRVEPNGGGDFKVHGDLTVRDITLPVVLDAEYEGQIVDPWGSRRAGFEARTEISRSAFGLKYNPLLETGGAVVGDKVKIVMHVELVRPA